MKPRMRLGLSSCWPVGFEGGPDGFCCEGVPLALEFDCWAASVSVAIFGAGASGFSPVVFSVVAATAAAGGDGGESGESNASKAVTFFAERCGSSHSEDRARAGETATIRALA